jgi:hypothetical protein
MQGSLWNFMGDRGAVQMRGFCETGLRTLTLTVVILLLNTQIASGHYNYIGSGQWSTASVDWASYAASIYDGPTSAAVTLWDRWTDLTVTQTAQGNEDIGTYSGGYGTGAPLAWTVICVASGCYSSAPINEQYLYAEVKYNSTIMSNLSWSEIEAVASHEFGHSFSLHHTDLAGGVHIMYVYVLDVYHNYGINYPTQHDIDGVNARY